MKKSLWTILVVFVLTALGSTFARADTIIASGGNVTAINGITIAGTTYNVTFGTTDDMTFASDASNASTANADIQADLNSGAYLTAGSVKINLLGVDGGATTYFSYDGYLNGVWISDSESTSSYGRDNVPHLGLWNEFAVAPTSTPEPGIQLLTLTGLGLLGLTLVLRKGIAPGHQQVAGAPRRQARAQRIVQA